MSETTISENFTIYFQIISSEQNKRKINLQKESHILAETASNGDEKLKNDTVPLPPVPLNLKYVTQKAPFDVRARWPEFN